MNEERLLALLQAGHLMSPWKKCRIVPRIVSVGYCAEQSEMDSEENHTPILIFISEKSHNHFNFCFIISIVTGLLYHSLYIKMESKIVLMIAILERALAPDHLCICTEKGKLGFNLSIFIQNLISNGLFTLALMPEPQDFQETNRIVFVLFYRAHNYTKH